MPILIEALTTPAYVVLDAHGSIGVFKTYFEDVQWFLRVQFPIVCAR